MPGAKGKNIDGNAANAAAALPTIAARRAKAAYPWRWQPGQSGNPGGLSKFYQQSRKIARDASPAVMRELVNLALSAEDERVKSVCAVAVLDRAGLRPIDYDPAQDQPQPSSDPGKLTAEEPQHLRGILEKALGRGSPRRAPVRRHRQPRALASTGPSRAIGARFPNSAARSKPGLGLSP
jgi:hypothetical protein